MQVCWREIIALLCVFGIAFAGRPVRAQESESPEPRAPEIVVTATRVERELFETPQAVTVIDDEQVREANATATPDLFTYAEGVYIQKTNLGGGSPFIRGLTGKQVLLLVDGVRLNNSFYRFGPHQYLNTLDPNIIERVEVVRGPTSVLYGSDALGGTINIITRRRTDFSQDTGGNGLFQASYASATLARAFRAQAEGNWGDAGMLAGATVKRYGDVDGGGDIDRQRPSAYDEVDADFKFNYRFSADRELIFAQQYVRQYDVPKTSEITLGDKLKFNYEPQQRELYYLEYRAKDLGPFDDLKANMSYNRQKEGEENIKESSPGIETRELTDVRTPGAFVQLSNRVGSRQRLTYGLEYYRDDYDTEKEEEDRATSTVSEIAPGTPDGAHYESLGVYAQDEVGLGTKTDAILGVRYSRFDTEGEVGSQELNLTTDKVTGSVNLLYRLSPRLNLVGGVAEGFRAPNMEDFFGRVDFFSEIPNTDLEPEASLSREIGIKYYSSHGYADLYYHYTDYEGFIDRVEVAPGVFQRQNINDAWIQGVEAGFGYDIGRKWRVYGNATWTEGEDDDSSEPLRRIPPLNGTLNVRYNASARRWYEIAGLFADKQDKLSPGDIKDPRIPEGGTPGYGVVNLRAEFKPARGHEFLVALENIGDKKYKTHGSGVYAPGRSINLSYRASF